MFSVVFEVLPAEGQREAYLGLGKMLRPELEGIDGFVENIRYASLTREGWVLSVSHWRDEKAVVRWRTHARHHQAQDNGRTRILADYHLRVGEITEDTRLPEGITLEAQRLDETVAGEGTTLTLITMKRPDAFKETSNPADCAQVMGLDPRADGILEWDVFDAVLEPGNLILLISWRDKEAATRYENEFTVPDVARLQRVRVIRDYGMFDRREAPQYYADAKGRETRDS
jgi:heme-degrading monooxygenase HmoA